MVGTRSKSAALASPDRLRENVFVLAVVVPELKLRDVQRQILLADLVERADDATLEDRPEAFNRVRVHRSDNVLIARVIDDGVLRIAVLEAEMVGAEQRDFFRHALAHELLKRFLLHVPE